MSSKDQISARCSWANTEPAITYHDEEWGVPVHDDQTLFEFLVLEGAQAGLSWITILKKRENYRKAFDGFEAAKISRYGARDVRRLLADAGIVRNRLKIAATIQAIAKIKELVGQAATCFFCTTAGSSESSGARPMSVQQVDDAGHLWFLSASDSHKNQELAADPAVRLFFQGSAHSDFLMLSGTATISRDQAKIKKLWEPIIKTWFTGGVDDPRITVLEVAPNEGYYWDTKHGMAVAGIKMLTGAAIGKTMDDSIEEKLQV